MEKEKVAFFATLGERYAKELEKFDSMLPVPDEGGDKEDDDDVSIIEQVVASRHKPGSEETQYLCKWYHSQHRTWEDGSTLGFIDAVDDYWENGEVTLQQWRSYAHYIDDPNLGDDWPNGEKTFCTKCNHCTTSPVICLACGSLSCDNGTCTVIVVACVCVAGARVCSTPCVSAFTYLIQPRTQ
jgi:hypothetical protein